MKIQVKLNTIYFSRPDGTLGKIPVDIVGRMSKKSGEEYLIKNEIPYEMVFKVKKEDYIINVSHTQVKEI